MKLLLYIISLWSLSTPAFAGVYELGAGFSFDKRQFDDESFNWNRRWSFTGGYHFTDSSGIEVGFQDVVDRTFIKNFQDTTFHDQILSVSWIQTFFDRQSSFRPFFKAGVGQLFRKASGSYQIGATTAVSPAPEVSSVTAVFGIGFKYFFLQNMALRLEVTTYLPGGSLRTWQDNVAISIGTSFFF